ncbi:MAG TPA: type II toxin-antitoxin system VapC family toxin [Xanthobacteraceae bacterium]|nr:type II toxin-antitoxin system VapC family toxin [Xanthobacteraceae bacterium]
MPDVDAPLLLDTCAVIWVAEDQPISGAAALALDKAHAADQFVYVSPITAWEVGLLVARGRLTTIIKPQLWFERMLDVPNVRLADMSPDLLISSSFLPGEPPRDPADRILAATAREYGYTLVTRDRPLLTYAAQGHIQAVCC